MNAMPRGGVEVYLNSFFNLGARWGWVVNATPQPLYRQERDPVPIVEEAESPRVEKADWSPFTPCMYIEGYEA
jgi:hypothetical protein